MSEARKVVIRFVTAAGEYTRQLDNVLAVDFVDGRVVVTTPIVTYYFFDRWIREIEDA